MLICCWVIGQRTSTATVDVVPDTVVNCEAIQVKSRTYGALESISPSRLYERWKETQSQASGSGSPTPTIEDIWSVRKYGVSVASWTNESLAQSVSCRLKRTTEFARLAASIYTIRCAWTHGSVGSTKRVRYVGRHCYRRLKSQRDFSRLMTQVYFGLVKHRLADLWRESYSRLGKAAQYRSNYTLFLSSKNEEIVFVSNKANEGRKLSCRPYVKVLWAVASTSWLSVNSRGIGVASRHPLNICPCNVAYTPNGCQFIKEKRKRTSNNLYLRISVNTILMIETSLF